MPSSYTSSARFTLQATGENNNTWGVILNNGVFQLVDDSINGRIGLALSGNHTLTTNLGATDEARMRMIDVTGGSGGTITIPAVPKGYFVRNGASGPVTISAGGTNAVFQPGEAGGCHTDGTTVYPQMIAGLTVKGYVDQQIMASAITTPPILGHGGQVLSTDGVSQNFWTSAITGPFQAAGLTSTAGIQAGASSIIGFTGRSQLWSSADGQISFANNAGSNSVTWTLTGGNALTLATSGFTVGGNMGVSGALNVTGTTTLAAVNSGNHAVTGTLSTTGLATLNSLSVTGAATVGGTLGVTGTMTTATINASGNIEVAAAQLHGWTGRAQLGSPADGQFAFYNNAVNQSVTLTLTGGNAATFAGTYTFSGGCTFNSGVGVSGGLVVNTGGMTVSAGGLTVNGLLTANNGLTSNTDITVNGDIYAIRPASPSSGVICLGNAGAYLYYDGSAYQFAGGHTVNTAGGGITCGLVGAGCGLGGFQNISMLSAQGQPGGPYGYAAGFYAPTSAYGCLEARCDTVSQYFCLWAYNASGVGSIRTTDGVNTAYNTTSDERLKIFLGAYTAAEANAIIKADPVRAFTWNEFSGSPGKEAIGWGAQTSYAVSPDLASPAVNEDLDENGKPLHNWETDKAARTPYLWAAIGADGGILDRLAALEAEVARLKKPGLFR
jgi:hypothetical protein